MITELFQTIDKKDHIGFSRFLTHDCLFRFGNHPEVAGSENIQEYIKGFFNSISGLSHVLLSQWEVNEAIICHGNVTYTRMDGSTLTVPFANVLELVEGKIKKYLIFADTSKLYQ